MQWAIAILRASREHMRPVTFKLRPKATRPVVVDRPLQYRTLLLRCLFKIVDETPELTQITIVLATLLKNRELMEWCRTNSTEGAAVEEGMKESLREYADVHLLDIHEQPQRPTKYVIYHRIFRELLSKIYAFIKGNSPLMKATRRPASTPSPCTPTRSARSSGRTSAQSTYSTSKAFSFS